jgi:hypothetical protein
MISCRETLSFLSAAFGSQLLDSQMFSEIRCLDSMVPLSILGEG